MYRKLIPVVVLYPASVKVHEDVHRELLGNGNREGKAQLFDSYTILSSTEDDANTIMSPSNCGPEKYLGYDFSKSRDPSDVRRDV